MRKLYLLGYAVGYIYPHDGEEMLCRDSAGNTCGWHRETGVWTLAKAKEIAEKLAVGSSWQVFYRPYFLDSDKPQSLPEWNGDASTVLVGTPHPMVWCEGCKTYRNHNHTHVGGVANTSYEQMQIQALQTN